MEGRTSSRTGNQHLCKLNELDIVGGGKTQRVNNNK